MTTKYIFIDALRYVDIYLNVSWKKKQSFTKARSTIGISTRKGVLIGPISKGISQLVHLSTYIGRYGKIITVRFQRAIKSIIKTITLRTTTSRILSCFQSESIGFCIKQKSPMKIGREEENKQSYLDHSRKLGTLQKRAMSGIKNMVPKLGKSESLSRGYASNVVRRLQQKLFIKNIAQITANRKQGASLVWTTSQQPASHAGRKSLVINITRPSSVQLNVFGQTGKSRVRKKLSKEAA